MSGMAGRVHAVRGRLARLVAVLAVLVGVALTVGLQCTDGMAMPMAHGASADAAMACDSPSSAVAAIHVADRAATADMGQVAATGTAPDAAADDGAPGSGVVGGVLATCLAVFLAVVVVLAALRPGPLWGAVRLLRPARVVAIRAVRPRAPTLAELCLLRT